MSRDVLVSKLVAEYFASRPNLNNPHNPLCVFFLACSGAGKSTLRNQLVEKLGATYVCNDEVRALLEEHPEATKQGIQLKEIVAKTWDRILVESPNKLVIFDCNIIQYYMYEDSYLNVAKRLGVPLFIVNIELPPEKLRERIIARGINTEQILAELPGQISDYRKAISDITPDWTLSGDSNTQATEKLINRLSTLGG